MNNRTDGMILMMIHKVKNDHILLVSTFGVLCWIFMPILVMLLNLFGVSGLDTYLIWVYSLYFVGTTGLLGFLCYCVNNITVEKASVKSLLKKILPLLLLVAFLMWALLSCLLSNNKKMAFFGEYPYINSWFTFFLYGGFLFDGLIVSKNKRCIRLVISSFLVVSSILTILSLMNNNLSFKLYNSNEFVGYGEYRSVFYNTNHYAYYLLISIMIVSFVIIYAESIKTKALGTIIFSLSVLTLILNNTFGAYIALIFTFIFLLIWWIANRRTGFESVCLVIVAFIITSAISVLFTDNIRNNFISLSSDVDKIVQDEDTSSVGSSRGELWENALVCIGNEPIFGCGLENIGSVPNDEDEEVAPSNPHNFILFFAKHTGIPGLILYLSVLFVCLYRSIRQRKNMSSQMEASAFIVLAYLISAFFGVAKFYTSPYYLLVLSVGLQECMSNYLSK